jgi:hypothetical protein
LLEKIYPDQEYCEFCKKPNPCINTCLDYIKNFYHLHKNNHFSHFMKTFISSIDQKYSNDEIDYNQVLINNFLLIHYHFWLSFKKINKYYDLTQGMIQKRLT